MTPETPDSDKSEPSIATTNSQLEIVRLAPEVTPEVLLKNLELQDRLKLQIDSPFAAQSPKQALLEVFRRNAKDALLTIKLLKQSRRDAATRQEKRGIAERIKHFKNFAAENLADLGKFREAAALSADNARKNLYLAYLEAVGRDDNEWCEHEKWRETAPGKFANNYFREFSFYSEQHNAEIAMLRCNICGFRNAADLPDDLRRMSEIRKKANQ